MTSESSKQKIAKIHDIFPISTKDQIAKILQYYDDDENKAVDALTRDGGEEALSSLADSGSLKSKICCALSFNTTMEAAEGTEKCKLEEKLCECKEIEWLLPGFFSKCDKGVDAFWESGTFFFNGNEWCLSFEIYPKGDLEMVMETKSKLKCRIKYYIGFKNKIHDRESYLKHGIFPEGESYFPLNGFDYQDLFCKRSNFDFAGDLTVICTLKSSPTAVMDEKKTLKLTNLDKLSDNFKNLFGDKETCDTTLKVKNKDFSAHRLVLIARSSVFAATFKHDSLESQTGVINIPDCDPDSFQLFLEYLYCGKLEDISLSDALNLYYTSDKYDVQELKAFCVDYLMQCLAVENVCEIAVLADKYDEMVLFSTVQGFFNKKSLEIFLTDGWDNLLSKDHRLANKLLKGMSKMKIKK